MQFVFLNFKCQKCTEKRLSKFYSSNYTLSEYFSFVIMSDKPDQSAQEVKVKPISDPEDSSATASDTGSKAKV